jgi:C_GCAxxG_C_C family probable redox protein
MKKEKAVQKFLEGYNCAQSIVSAFSTELGLKEKQALMITTGLGAGTNYQGKTCGAVLGAFIILGLRFGIDRADDQEGKLKLRKILDQFSKDFAAEHNSLDCKDILGLDVSKENELEELRAKNAFREVCPNVVETAARIVDRMLEETD